MVAVGRIFSTTSAVSASGRAISETLQQGVAIEQQLREDISKIAREGFLAIRSVSLANNINGDYSLINTGRHYIRAKEAAKNSNIRYIIGFNGTTLWDNKEKKEIFNKYLSKSAVENMIRYSEKNKHLIGFWLKEKVVLMDFSSDGHQYKDYYRDEKKWTELMPIVIKKHTDKENVEDIIESFQENVYKIQLIFERKEWQKNRFVIEKELNQLHNKDATVFMGSLPDIEVCVSDTSKSIGLERFIREMKIQNPETYAFGDGYNDIEILEYVDNAYVMSSATSREVIKLADEILEYDTGSIGRKIESIYNN
ncbi:MAG: HAD hydrolase family protein [Mycoplasmataceae bacterium]|nr:HAD hydrolase family protein [Mycoplasmataceae bacterium]